MAAPKTALDLEIEQTERRIVALQRKRFLVNGVALTCGIGAAIGVGWVTGTLLDSGLRPANGNAAVAIVAGPFLAGAVVMGVIRHLLLPREG